MGYTHYWRRPKELPEDEFKVVVADFNRVLPAIKAAGVKLAGGRGDGEPVLNEQAVIFNGATNCGHEKNEAISIPWPAPGAGGVAKEGENAQAGSWFAGASIEKRVCNGDCSYETFYFPRVFIPKEWDREEDGRFFQFTKTAFRPYDLAVICFLIIAKKWFGRKIEVSSDGEDEFWFDGKFLCQQELGYGLDFTMGADGCLGENRPSV